ncbi:MAG: hypothetical protein AMXMBFR13_08420 [Phycisphaerae bacterium]
MVFLLTVFAVLNLSAPPSAPALPPSNVRQVSAHERWELRDGRFYLNEQWVFLKTGKLLRPFERPEAADEAIADLDVLIKRLNYNNISLNIYPDQFDEDADGRVDSNRQAAVAGIRRIIDHCWQRGILCCLSFETYNVGGGGTPAALFKRHPDAVARNALLEPARDVEYAGPDGKWIPSIHHPAYLRWSRTFLGEFLHAVGRERAGRLFYVETTVEPQYLGACSVGDKDPRRAFLDFSDAARGAFERWRSSLSPEDAHRSLRWPQTQDERDALLVNRLFADFRAEALAEWVNGDAAVVRKVVPDVFIAMDYNGRFDDRHDLRLGSRRRFLEHLMGVDIIQIAPHTPEPWGAASWDDVNEVNRRSGRRWAITEHMTATGSWGHDNAEMTAILENTLARGTRFGWEFVNAGNRHERDEFHVYRQDWTSPCLDIIEGDKWPAWQRKIGAPPFVPRPRQTDAGAPQPLDPKP